MPLNDLHFNAKTVRVWDLATCIEMQVIKGHDDYVAVVEFNPDGQRLLTADTKGTLKLWDVVSGREVLELSHPEGIIDAGFTPDGKTIRALGSEGTVVSWSISRR